MPRDADDVCLNEVVWMLHMLIFGWAWMGLEE